MNDRLIQACQGVSYSRGGLNIPEMKQRLIQIFPHHEDEIKHAKTRSELNALCTQLLNSGNPALPFTPGLPSTPGRPSSPSGPSSPASPSSTVSSSIRSSFPQRFSSQHVVHQMYPVFRPLLKFEGDVSYLRKPQTIKLVIPVTINNYNRVQLNNHQLSQDDLDSIKRTITGAIEYHNNTFRAWKKHLTGHFDEGNQNIVFTINTTTGVLSAPDILLTLFGYKSQHFIFSNSSYFIAVEIMRSSLNIRLPYSSAYFIHNKWGLPMQDQIDISNFFQEEFSKLDDNTYVVDIDNKYIYIGIMNKSKSKPFVELLKSIIQNESDNPQSLLRFGNRMFNIR